MSNKLEDAVVDMRFLLCEALTSLAVEQLRVSRLSWDFVLRNCFVLQHHVTRSYKQACFMYHVPSSVNI